ncbi:hypothetical protein COOONC_25856 [Cooperia oncophora]
MSVGRAYHKATELDGFLYVTGTTLGENVWTNVAPLHTPRRDLSVSALRGCLYAVGGFDGASVLKTVER